jgi:hypothetical protein
MQAAEGFCRKNGVQLGDMFVKTDGKILDLMSTQLLTSCVYNTDLGNVGQFWTNFLVGDMGNSGKTEYVFAVVKEQGKQSVQVRIQHSATTALHNVLTS